MITREGYDSILREQEKYYDASAGIYVDWAANLARSVAISEARVWKAEWSDLDSRIAFAASRAERIIEVGCGPSRIPPGCTPGHIVFLDASERMLRLARAKHGIRQCAYIQARVQEMGLRPNTFDLVICTQLLSHFPDELFRSITQDLWSSVSEGGTLLVSDSLRPIVPNRMELRNVQRRHQAGGTFRVYKKYRKPECQLELVPEGLVEQLVTGTYLYTVSFRKRSGQGVES